MRRRRRGCRVTSLYSYRRARSSTSRSNSQLVAQVISRPDATEGLRPVVESGVILQVDRHFMARLIDAEARAAGQREAGMDAPALVDGLGGVDALGRQFLARLVDVDNHQPDRGDGEAT